MREEKGGECYDLLKGTKQDRRQSRNRIKKAKANRPESEITSIMGKGQGDHEEGRVGTSHLLGFKSRKLPVTKTRRERRGGHQDFRSIVQAHRR